MAGIIAYFTPGGDNLVRSIDGSFRIDFEAEESDTKKPVGAVTMRHTGLYRRRPTGGKPPTLPAYAEIDTRFRRTSLDA
jgi:hypothetical protein